MPPLWIPLAALAGVITVSALRLLDVQSAHGVKAYGFGRHAEIQRVAERNWRLAVAASVAFALIAWARPEWEVALGRPDWSGGPALRWLSATLFLASFLIIAVAQIQMGASWRIGVPKEGPGALVAHGLFRWSRNPIFVGMIGTLIALFLWSPHGRSFSFRCASRRKRCAKSTAPHTRLMPWRSRVGSAGREAESWSAAAVEGGFTAFARSRFG